MAPSQFQCEFAIGYEPQDVELEYVFKKKKKLTLLHFNTVTEKKSFICLA